MAGAMRARLLQLNTVLRPMILAGNTKYASQRLVAVAASRHMSSGRCHACCHQELSDPTVVGQVDGSISVIPLQPQGHRLLWCILTS